MSDVWTTMAGKQKSHVTGEFDGDFSRTYGRIPLGFFHKSQFLSSTTGVQSLSLFRIREALSMAEVFYGVQASDS